MHDLTIIHMLALALAVALVFGWLTQRLGLSPLVGYLLAGIVVGPYTPGFVADRTLAAQLAEMGVILLLFGVGLHFHPKELFRVWQIAVPGAIAQSAVATGLGWGLARMLGWSDGTGIVLGMALSVASTVVLSRMLMESRRLEKPEGRVAIGWLIVEDLFTVVALVILPALATKATGLAMATEIASALGKVALFALIAWLGGRWLLSPALEHLARVKSAELFTLGVFVAALGVALLASEGFHVSVALGAFFAGLVVGQSRIGVQATADVAPFRDVFAALFFVSVGMLFDPAILLQQPLMVGGVLAIVLLAKPAIAWVVVRMLGHPRSVAATVSVGLAQIGEFSFILASLGSSVGLVPEEGFNAIVAAALVSIAINPLLFLALPRLTRDPTAPDSGPATTHPDGVLIAGFGPVGQRLCAELHSRDEEFVLIVQDMSATDDARALGYNTCFGDPGHAEVLEAAGVRKARMLILTDIDLPTRMRASLAARERQPQLHVVAVAANAGERGWMQEFGIHAVVEADRSITAGLLAAMRRADEAR